MRALEPVSSLILGPSCLTPVMVSHFAGEPGNPEHQSQCISLMSAENPRGWPSDYACSCTAWAERTGRQRERERLCNRKPFIMLI